MNALACTNCQMLLAPGARFCSHCGTLAPTPQITSLPREASGTLRRGTILQERYKIMTFIGAGGFSRVYGAIDLRLKVPCAIKENNEFDQSAHVQFLAEAQLLARLRHPSMTKVSDYFTDPSGAQFLVMEFVPGKDLEKLMDEAETIVSWRTVAEWGKIVCDVLTYLHTQDPPIIHRDIKPANLRLTPNGDLMVIDLGIAKEYRDGTATNRAAQAYSGGYSPIEQYLGQGTDPRSDLYALGATLYHLLVGKMPPEAPNRLRGISMQTVEQARPDIPVLMARAVDRAMAIEPEHRPPSAAALHMVFERVLEQDQAVSISQPAVVAQFASARSLQAAAHAVAEATAEPAVISQPRIGTQPRSSTNAGKPSRPLQVPSELRAERLPHGMMWEGDNREMVRVMAGVMPMGSEGNDPDEVPVHRLDLKTFLIDRFPVTCADYARFVQETGTIPPRYWGGPLPPHIIEDHPVVEVTHDEARAYAQWAGKRLPTEAEWEKAATWDATTGHKRVYPWGDQWDANRANARDGGAGGTVPIGAYSPQGDSPCGAAEMAGNIWEWTDTAYKRYPYDPGDGRDFPNSAGLRVTRGGSWSCSPDALRGANRNIAAANDADFEVGFRCAADVREDW
ncbi:SUMF1/EgtB/PvdO family nonheme iron enzyme [Herpetosiphon llansteffanensis]|uniref:SUMF1/EgtB/PvdO family nonheme iron enzyme n=1 Tax=Herpetosiphon llansteffanensis TaxID=2094568 RepID=UPI0013DFD742|nr:SUMF1/EgtB/PvdO family nonheme iron enzyme [Herpetosiphon llansteffanensis]